MFPFRSTYAYTPHKVTLYVHMNSLMHAQHILINRHIQNRNFGGFSLINRSVIQLSYKNMATRRKMIRIHYMWTRI